MNGKIKIAEEFIQGNYYEFEIHDGGYMNLKPVKCKYLKQNSYKDYVFLDEENLELVELPPDRLSSCETNSEKVYHLLDNCSYIHYEAEQIENSSCLKIKVWNDKGKTVESTVSLQYKIDELIKIGGLK